MRIASVLPSATEIVCALGAGAELVARSEECDFPSSVRDLPVLMRARTRDADRPSAEIDRRVREVRGSGESLYELDLEALARLRPDVLLTQDLCGVCSVTESEVEAACLRAGVRPRIVSLSPRSLDDVWDSVETVGEAIGRPDAAGALAARLRARAAPSAAPPRGGVVVIEWLDPPILAGLWTPEIVRRAGGVPLGPARGEPGRRTDWDEVASLAPELAILSPCSFPVDRTLRELGAPNVSLPARRALAGARTVVADEAYFSRPGPRLADGVELVRRLLSSSPSSQPYPMPVRTWEPAGVRA